MTSIVWAFTGPRLIRLLKHENNQGRNYDPNILESCGDKIIRVYQTVLSLSWLTTPVVSTMLYRRDYFNHDGMVTIGKFLLSVFVVFLGAFGLRGFGRLTNPDYMVFINILVQVLRSPTLQNKRLLHHYDFDFWAWPVDFSWDEAVQSKGERVRRTKVQVMANNNESSAGVSSILWRTLGYAAMHTFGRRMVYPGSTSLMQMLVGGMLNQGRASLIEEKNGLRAKILTEDKNEIDTMFVDRRQPRNARGHNGNTLVVCFEGNAGFYEMGCSGTPIECGYSVLGWNHPGFGGSSGIPYPDAEQNAIDAVMQYAIQHLGFHPDSIILFAWSIGGYSASWAAMNYPDVKHVILDATFDDIVPLALTQMPQSFESIVITALRNYMNLNIADQLVKYPGPIKLIRRSRDEIISTEKINGTIPVLASNRGNFLLIKLLKHRYRHIVNAKTIPLLEDYLKCSREQQGAMLMERRVNLEECENRMRNYAENSSVDNDNGRQYSQAVQEQLTLFLAHKYMVDFDSTHCTPLPTSYFTPPWTPTQ